MYDEEPTMMGQNRPSANLVIRQGTQAGMSFPILGNQAIIGREEGVDIVLQDPESSRRHTRISWQAGQFVIEDLGSTNGTFINGVQITSPQLLNPGDSIGIGQTVLVFQAVGGQATEALQGALPQQQATPAYNPGSPAASGQEGGFLNNKTTQYVLYGCGCLLLLCICSLLSVAGWALLFPQIFEDVTGIPISWSTVEILLNVA